ncbi:MAG TPA: 30S ribosomal protein S8e [archaeon]|jgi:ribosomal protein S8E|nr:30S ribosomal protein S8e [archaeon]HRT02369.1 30S ribosomal protein S8e [Candidatus Diapherotrites archaeon]
MVEWKQKSRRKKSGGINNSIKASTKKLSDRGGTFSKTTIDTKDERYKSKSVGGNTKIKLRKAQSVLISDGPKTYKGKIINVIENVANKHFVRQRIITKGAVLTVDVNGKEMKVKVTSRPGQSGNIYAVPYTQK